MNRNQKGWFFIFGAISVLFIPLFIGVSIHRVEPILISLIGPPVIMILGINYELPFRHGVNHDV